MSKPGQTLQTLAQEKFKVFRSRVPLRMWLFYGGLFIVATAFQVLVLKSNQLGWFMAGATASTAVVHFVYRLQMIDGSENGRTGALAEQWTARELDRRKNWEVFHSLPIGPSDIDHVAVSQDGIFVFETKVTNHEWHLHGEALRGAVGDHLASVARRAWRLTHHLRPAGISEVTPVLVVWGTTPAGSPSIQMAGNVTVVWAANPDWVFSLEGRPLDRHTVSKAIAELRSFQEAQLALRSASAG